MLSGKKGIIAPLREPVLAQHNKVIDSIEEVVYKVDYRNVRDLIIARLRKEFPTSSFVEPLCAHLSQMGRTKLDTFNDIILILPSKRRIHFITPLREGTPMFYTIESFDSLVPNDMKKRTLFGIEY